MANTSVPVTPGSGAPIAVNQAGGLDYQVVKLDAGADGASYPLVGDGTHGLPADVTRVQGDVSTLPKSGQVWPVNDNGGSLTVDDGGSSLTVDAPVASPLSVRISNGASNVDTLPVSGTVTGNQGSPNTTGNAWPHKITDGTTVAGVDAGTQGLKAYIVGGGGGGVAQQDGSTFTEGSTTLNPIGGEFNDSAGAVGSGKAGVARITPNRAVHANLRRQDGTEIGTSGTPVRTDPTGTTTQPVSGTVTAQLNDNTGTPYGPTNPLVVTTKAQDETRVSNAVAFTASQTDATLWTPTTGKKFYVRSISIAFITAGRIQIYDGTNASANMLFQGTVAANTVVTRTFDKPWASSAINNVLKYTTGTVVTGDITVYGYEA